MKNPVNDKIPKYKRFKIIPSRTERGGGYEGESWELEVANYRGFEKPVGLFPFKNLGLRIARTKK